MAADMVILTRTFDLLAWLLPKLEHFPKPYRFTITQRMMDAALDFQEALFEAQSQGARPVTGICAGPMRRWTSCGSICVWRITGTG